MAIQILLRRDVAADWTTNNPVLGTGEFGYETDTKKYKVGDGATAWTTLGYHEHYSTAFNTKLSQIETAAEVNLPTNLAYTASTRILTSSTGNNITLPEATTAVPGLSSAADKNKLDNIEVSADVTDSDNVVAALTAGANVAISAGGEISSTDTTYTGGYKIAVNSSNQISAEQYWMLGIGLVDNSGTLSVDLVDEDNMVSNSATKLPTQQSVKAYVDAEVASAAVSEMTYKGAYNASTNSPDLDTSPIASALGDVYTVTVAGTFFTIAVEIGDVLIAEQASPTLEAHWTIVNKNLDAASIKTSYESNPDTNVYDNAAVTKLGNIEASATADQTDTEIRTAVEAAADSNVFTDADHTKLNNIAASATSATTPSDVGLGNLSSNGNALSGNFTVTGTLEVQGGIIEDATTGTTSFNVSTASVFTTTSTSGAFTFSGAPSSGKVGSVTLVSTPSGTPAYTWHSSVKWAGATPPTASGSGLTDIFTFFTVDGGTTWHGVISSLNSA